MINNAVKIKKKKKQRQTRNKSFTFEVSVTRNQLLRNRCLRLPTKNMYFALKSGL